MKKYIKIITPIFVLILLFILSTPSFATQTKSFDINDLDFSSISKEKEEALKNKIEELKTNSNIDVLSAYKQITAIVSNEEISTLIENNRETLNDAGVDNSTISAASTMLNSFEAETIIDIAENDLNIDELIEKAQSDENFDLEGEIAKKVESDLSLFDGIRIIFKLLFSIMAIRITLIILFIIAIYSIFITGLIFKKAGKPSFATVIPLYRDIVHLKICGFTPWVLLLLIIPVFRLACISCNCDNF